VSVPTDPDIIAAAVAYARRGFSVLPLKLDKRPAVLAWKQRQTLAATPEQAAEWFGRVSNVAAVGIILGAVSGDIYVRDFDDPAVYEAWRAAHPDLAASLPTVKTARGFHVWARWKGLQTAEMPGGELRAEGAYVVAPPSPHASGAFYAWIVPLPEGALPEVDPFAAGLAVEEAPARKPRATERTEKTERTESTKTPETTDETEDNGDTQAIWGGADLRLRILDAITRTLPAEFCRRNYHVFKLARALRGFPEFAEIAAANIKRLRPIVKEWHRRALPHIITKDFGITWGDFVHAWPQVKFPEGSDTVGDALAAAEAADPPGWTEDYCPECRLLASLCRELQRRAGDAPFFLSADTAGRAVGKDKTTAARWFKAFIADGALVVVTPGTKENRRATRYQYVAKDLHTSK